MPSTVQRGGGGRPNFHASDPPSPSPAKRRTATARKSTGSRPPMGHSRGDDDEDRRASTSTRGRQSNQTSTAGTRRKPRFRPGTVALREIRKYQKSTDLLLRRLPFARLASVVLYLPCRSDHLCYCGLFLNPTLMGAMALFHFATGAGSSIGHDHRHE